MSKTLYEYDRIADRKRVDFIAETLAQQLPADARILDVGCGNGVISRHLGRLGFRVTGIDVSERTIEKARSIDPLPNVAFITKSAEELVAEGTRYEAVICSEVLEHLHDPGALLEVLYASLTDNGVLIVTVPNGRGPRESFVTRPVLNARRRNGWLWRTVVGAKKLFGYSGTTVQSDADNLDHVQFFSKNDLEKLSAAHRFRITRFGSANFVEDVFPFSFFAKRLPFLQKMDCALADRLPVTFSGGFFTVWEKK
ncbi:class I SAM-dependent methyltransferase [Dinghuibacter silviterrae]|uniref:Ubiquinone biosynthesis O-methyltransferase n=1 Tax=Dinghuibacter silviterrae TaxID=1539049 RepID=A0A4R8DU81_9BACT|nr:methyltransferase domain-containing protein [Dinghuibacter silviterrae]TDX01914.1 ubiquinone biosynthesis O-methyltransferase [Dinghuibacter silviterrae]